MFRSITFKTNFTQAAVILITAITIALSSYIMIRDHLQKGQEDYLLFVARSISEESARTMKNLRNMMDRVTISREFEEYHEKYRDISLAQHFSKFKDYFPVLTFLNETGDEEVKAINGKNTQPVYEYGSTDEFQAAMRSPGTVVVSQVQKSKDLGGEVLRMFLAKREYFGNEFNGVLMGEVPVRFFDEQLRGVAVGTDGFILIADSSNRIIATSETVNHHIDEIIDDGITMSAPGGPTAGQGLSRSVLLGVDSVFASVKTENTGWTVIVALPYEEYKSAANALIRNIIIVLILVLGIGLFISGKLSGSITGPIMKLSKAAETVSEQGDFSQKVSIDSNDEIGILASSFNKMLDTLSFTTVSRKEYYEQNKFLNHIVDSIPYPFLVVNINDFSVRLANSAASGSVDFKLMTCHEMADRTGMPCIWNEHACALESIRDTKQPVIIECLHHDLNNSPRYHTIYAYPVFNHRNEVVEIIEYSMDITDNKRAEMEVIMYAEKLKISNRELQEFAYIASHDLQEPLRKISAFGDRLKVKYAEVLDEQGRDYLARMQNAAKRMQNLINGLLMFSRVTTKGQPFVPVDLSGIVREVLSDLEVRIEQTGGHVDVEGLATVEADPLQMRQLFQNLIGNALKFHRDNEPPVVKVSGGYVQSNGDNPGSDLSEKRYYEIKVEDNGIGFDPVYAERIFGIFQRLHGRQEYEGTGIGLSVCKKIAERHGGSITAISSPQKGATFSVVLPVNHQADEKMKI